MAVFNPKQVFTLSGDNMNFIEAVKVGDLFVEDLRFLGTTGVSGTIPAAAYTNNINIVTAFGTYSIGSQNVILTSSDQVVVGPLSIVSGNAGDVLVVTGENFYQITDVEFGGTKGNFNLVDDGTIEVEIPSDADHTGISIFSSLRSGVNGGTSLSSGISPDEFIPIPDVSGMNSTQLVSGSILSVTGFSFGAVTGLRFGSLPPTPVQQNLTNTKNYIVPSGNTRGVPSFLLYSGGEAAFPSSLYFSPLADVTGVGPVGNTAKTGELIYISGDNFSTGILYKTGDNYLGTVMGRTIEFGLVNDKVASGIVPSGIPIFTSGGGNVAAGEYPTVSSGIVSLFSDQYPETYPSATFFTPDIGPPIITSITPSSGIAGDFLSIKGRDLYAISGVNFLPSSSANVGIGTYDAGTVAEVVPGYEYSFQVGAAASLGLLGEPYNVTLSGWWGAATVNSGFYSLGSPTITSIDPSGETIPVLPGATGFIAGTNFYSGTVVELWTGDGFPGHYKMFSTLPSSGYDTTNYDEIKFDYPDSFPTGIEYRIKARNRRSSTPIVINDLNVFNQPFLSGFTPLSGEFGDTITVSGFFENMVTSGLSVGSVVSTSFDQPATTGFTFQIPNNSSTDVININTSGGIVVSSGLLGVFLSKPSISGFYSGAIAPDVIDYNQVFRPGDILTISGERMNLVTGVKFSGDGTDFVAGTFRSKGYSELSLNVPVINPESGKFSLLDFKNREVESNSTGVNIVSVTGFNNYLLPSQAMELSGYNISGMDVLFPYATGGFATVSHFSHSLIGGGPAEKISVQIPTGIVFGEMRITGRSNSVELNNVGAFYPLGVITGISGLQADNTIESGSIISLTGINVFDKTLAPIVSNTLLIGGSGAPLVGFTGNHLGGEVPEGVLLSLGETQQQFEINKYETGLAQIGGVNNVFYSKVEMVVPAWYRASGDLFFIDPWWSLTPDSRTESYRSQILDVLAGGATSPDYDRYFFPATGDELIYNNLNTKTSAFNNAVEFTGVTPFVSGFSPIRGGSDTEVELSGSGLNFINSVVMSNTLTRVQTSCNFSGDDTKLQINVPSLSLNHLGNNNIILAGTGPETFACHTGYTISGERTGSYISGGKPLNVFEYLLASQALDFQAVAGGLPEPQAELDRVVNFMAEETVGGVVFLVTKAKFPDGSTMVVSSVPKS